jgi:hypothetical protein
MVNRREVVIRALAGSPPDLVVLVCQASEVDAGIDDDLLDVRRVLDALERGRGGRVPVIAVVSKIDELAPPDVRSPPFEDDDKRTNIKTAVQRLAGHLRRHRLDTLRLLPVASYLASEPGASVQWNIEVLGRAVVASVPSPMRLESILAPRELAIALDDASRGIVGAFASRSTAALRDAGRVDAREVEFSVDFIRDFVVRTLASWRVRDESQPPPRSAVRARLAEGAGWLRTVAQAAKSDVLSVRLAHAELLAACEGTRRAVLDELQPQVLATKLAERAPNDFTQPTPASKR